MAITYTMTWAGGLAGAPSGGFILTDHDGVAHQHSFDSNSVANITDFVKRAVADELANQAGAATGTVTVTIA